MRRKEKFGGVTVGGVRQKEEKKRSAQLLLVLAMLITGFGAVLSFGGSMVGYGILVIGLLSFVALHLGFEELGLLDGTPCLTDRARTRQRSFRKSGPAERHPTGRTTVATYR